jgi:hypothetical protein
MMFGREKGVLERNAPSDLWRRTLSQIPTIFGRLVYLSSLRGSDNGVYEHHGLALNFGPEQAHKALLASHLEAFHQWLAFGLEQQKADLDLYLSALTSDRRTVVDTWSRLTPYRNVIPQPVAQRERSLFLADFERLLQFLRHEHGVSLPPQDA